MGGRYRNKKTGKIYWLTAKHVINATNNNDGQIMVMYEDGEHIFVMEEKEFYEKFEVCTF